MWTLVFWRLLCRNHHGPFLESNLHNQTKDTVINFCRELHEKQRSPSTISTLFVSFWYFDQYIYVELGPMKEKKTDLFHVSNSVPKMANKHATPPFDLMSLSTSQEFSVKLWNINQKPLLTSWKSGKAINSWNNFFGKILILANCENHS